jgi:hypothetical protein
MGVVMQSFMQCICMYIQTNSITLKLYTIYTSYNKIENCTYLLIERPSTPWQSYDSIGQWIPKIDMVHNPYPHGLVQGTKPWKHPKNSNLNSPPTNGLSFPTCLSHPRNLHLHCHRVHQLLHLPFLGLQQ